MNEEIEASKLDRGNKVKFKGMILEFMGRAGSTFYFNYLRDVYETDNFLKLKNPVIGYEQFNLTIL